MRTEILKLKDLGRMPNESANDPDSIVDVIRFYDELLGQIRQPISFEEAEVLVQIFPKSSFYDLQWDLLKLVESVILSDDDKYIQLINTCPSQEWKDILNIRYNNYNGCTQIHTFDSLQQAVEPRPFRYAQFGKEY